MSLGSQVGARLEGEKKKKKKKRERHQYGIVYNTSERASLSNCEKRSCGKLAVSLTSDLSVDNITHTHTHKHTHTHTLHGDPPDEGCDRRASSYNIMNRLKIILFHIFFLDQSFAVSASLKYLGSSQFPLRLSLHRSFPHFFRIQREKKKQAKSSVYSQLGRSVDMAARELKELKDCVWSVPAG